MCARLQCSDSNSTLCFNGVRLYPYIFNNRTSHLGYDVTFNLTKPSEQRVATVTASLYVAGSSSPFGKRAYRENLHIKHLRTVPPTSVQHC